MFCFIKNTVGGFVCKCPAGYQLVGGLGGKKCKLVKKVTQISSSRNQGVCISIPRPLNGYMRCTRRKTFGKFAIGTKCKLKCRRGFVPSAYMKKKCVDGGNWIGSDATCVDESKPRTTSTISTTTTTTTTTVSSQL